MKPPRKGAITKALAILMESIKEENGSQLVYGDTAAFDSASLETLAEVDNALGIASSCISQVINTLIADIRYRRNRAAPIHQLPAEVFTTIVTCLTDDYSPKEGERHMLNLMVVSRRWQNIIVDSPHLWTSIRSDHPHKIAKLIIDSRSKSHPLSLAWDTSQSDDLDSNDEEFKSMLELITRNSSRLRSMEVTIGWGSQQTLRRLLDCPKPRLESLYVNLSRQEFDDAAMHGFMLSEGTPLKELVLDSAGLLDWDSPRLSGLRVLNLRKPASLPSINQLLLILSTSPLLTQLKLCVFDSPRDIPDAQTEQTSGEKLIELPHLKTISIRRLPPSYCTSILSRIRPRFCEYVDVMEYQHSSTNTMPGELWRERSDTMVALLQLSKLSDSNRTEKYKLSIRVTEWQVIIENAAQSRSHNSKVSFGHTDAHHALEVLGEFFSSLDFKIPSLSLRLEEAPIWEHKQLGLHQWSCSLENLYVEGIHMARAVHEVLGQQLLLEDGTMGWICPRLSEIRLFYGCNSYVDDSEDTEMDDGMALLLAVQKRWSGETGIPAAPQPKEFAVWFGDGIFASIRSRVEAIRSIVPCFHVVYG